MTEQFKLLFMYSYILVFFIPSIKKELFQRLSKLLPYPLFIVKITQPKY
jgi:hypothetical protein